MRAWTLVPASLLGLAGAAIHDHRDLQRARAKVPRASWKGDGHEGMVETLNGHLVKMFPNTKPCEEWSAEELQVLQEALYSASNPDFDGIYSSTQDSRRMLESSLQAHKGKWAQSNAHAQEHGHMRRMHRDGHCHEAVMWLIHHVSAPEQHNVFSRVHVPLLSTTRHSCEAGASAQEAALCDAYEMQVTCADCHSGTGIDAQNYTDLDGKLPEDPEYPGWARQRRCDQQYGDCGPCDGIGGPYWGDEMYAFQPTNCRLISAAEDVPVEDRMPSVFPQQFIIHQVGSDRLSRQQNAGQGFLPPSYSQIRSAFWYDFPIDAAGKVPSDSNGTTRLRHDTFYDDDQYSQNANGLVTELHFQTEEQRSQNITGPMVSLLERFLGMPWYMGGLTCVDAPVGIPTLGGIVDVIGKPHVAFGPGDYDQTYLGRIEIGVEYDGYTIADQKGYVEKMSAKRNMTVDHYTKWFLHLYVDADPDSPTYKQPVRFYGPYSGFAVYVTIEPKQPPADTWELACPDNGWGVENPTDCGGKKITDYEGMNPNDAEVCYDWIPPVPATERAPTERVPGTQYTGAFGSFFLPDEAEHLVV